MKGRGLSERSRGREGGSVRGRVIEGGGLAVGEVTGGN